jgi:hemolysin activation/secretion protein
MRDQWQTAKRAAICLLRGALAALSISANIAFADQQPKAPIASPAVFDVEAYDVDGAKLLRQIDVETAIYPFLGPGRSREDIDHAREALEKAYHDRGFQSVVVELPPQSVSDNIVRLHVVEAPLGRVRVTGARYFSPDFIRQEASAFQEGQVPDLNKAQQQLADINRLPDRRVTPLLRAGATPGTVDVDLKVADVLPLHASLEVNNDHSLNTPDLRLDANIHYDNLWQLGHSLNFTYLVSPEDRAASEIYSGSYLAPIWGTHWSLLAYGYLSNSNVATLGASNVLGKGYAIGGRAILQLPHGSDWSQSVSFGGDYKVTYENNLLGGVNNCRPDVFQSFIYCTRVEYWPITASYSFQRQGSTFSTQASVSVTAALRGLGSTTADYANGRSSARPDWVHLNIDVTETETLGRGFEASQRLVGQLSNEPLVTSEEFAAGGLTSVRGYLQAEAVGDDGYTGSLEIRSPSLAPNLGRFADDLRLYGFADGGVLRVLDPLKQQADFFSVASVGVGLRVELLKHLKGDVLGALPLISGTGTRADRPQLTFSVKSEF